MKSNIFIEGMYHHKFIENKNYEHDERIIRFYKDLFDIYDTELDLNFLFNGKNNSFIDMSDYLIGQLSNHSFIERPDLLIIAHETPDINPAVSTTSYLNYKYNWEAKAFGITNQGKFSSFASFEIVKNYFLNENINNAILIFLEQHTYPLSKDSVQNSPTDVGSIFHITKKESVLELIYTMNESCINFSLRDFPRKLLRDFNISSKDIKVITNDPTVFNDYVQTTIIPQYKTNFISPFIELSNTVQSPISNRDYILVHYQDQKQISILLFRFNRKKEDNYEY